ncbi:hypothetical protein ACFFWE_28115 [Sphaerisporangium melleum]|uniref:Uncharacterized protein n=1 Tax=Sphaerisporangium melleum TaxID=321316 RepID=A0A917VST9_9ACTN|nr:hypothetical protein [Sphaerisporangium melleum]GGL11080.1 hypothetical protein GCM10007964_61580 [Sphaerisporangium melleum]
MVHDPLGVIVNALRRILANLKARQHIEAYALTVVVFVFALLSIFSDELNDNLRWAVLLSGLGLLIYRVTLPEPRLTAPADILHDRSIYERSPVSSLFETARDVRVFAPSAVNLLSAQTCETLRRTVLARRGGSVRVVILDQREREAVRLAAAQLDESVDFPVQRLPAALRTTMEHLALMSAWRTAGSFAYRLLPYNPGFSLVLIDPDTPRGRLIVEIHGFHNLSTSSRMHLELTRDHDERWYAYWVEQFDHIWNAARQTVTPTGGEAAAPGSANAAEAQD